MAHLKLDPIVRSKPAPAAGTALRSGRGNPPISPDDVRAGALFRGLLYGVPIGLVMWLLLAFLLWRFA